MPQARGSQTRVYITDETTYSQDPGSPNSDRLYVTSVSGGSSQNKLDDDTLTDTRTRNRPTPGNIDASLSLSINLAAEDSARLFKHAFGTISTFRPALRATSNITGVTIEYAQISTPLGQGTLSYTAAGTSLSWTANGDTAGTGVDVSAGGTFTIPSGSTGADLTVTVVAGSLPGTNQSDNINIPASFEHRFTIGDLPVGFVLEKDFGANIASNRYEKFNGCRVASLAVDYPTEGFVAVSAELKAATSVLASALLDATPNDYGHSSFSSSQVVTIEEGGAVLGKSTECNFTLNNELDETGYVIGGGGIRGDLPEGFATVTGQAVTLFESTDLMNKAINNTESSLRVVLSRGTGDGTDGNGYVELHAKQLEWERNSVPIDGPAGLRLTMGFKAYGPNALTAKIRNTVVTP